MLNRQAISEAEPEVVVHQLTALSDVRDARNFERAARYPDIQADAAYVDAVRFVPVGPAQGSCGTAAHRREPPQAQESRRRLAFGLAQLGSPPSRPQRAV